VSEGYSAGWVIPVLSRKIVVVAVATAVAGHPHPDQFIASPGRLSRCNSSTAAVI